MGREGVNGGVEELRRAGPENDEPSGCVCVSDNGV